MRPIGLWLTWNASTTASVASGVRFFDIMRCWVSLYLQRKIKQHHRRACENDEVILVNNQAGFLKENRLDLWSTWWYFDQYLNLLRDIFGWHMPGTSKMSLETYIASTPNNPVTVKSDTLVLNSFSKRKPGFFATIFRVRAFYSKYWMQGFLPQMWKNSFPFENPVPVSGANSLNFGEEIPNFSYCKNVSTPQRLLAWSSWSHPPAWWLAGIRSSLAGGLSKQPFSSKMVVEPTHLETYAQSKWVNFFPNFSGVNVQNV